MAALSFSDWRQGTFIHTFCPVVDYRSLPRHPFHPKAPEMSAHVPMVFGTCRNESILKVGLRALSEDEALGRLVEMGISSEDSIRLLGAFRATRPAASPREILSAIATELHYRRDAILMAERK